MRARICMHVPIESYRKRIFRIIRYYNMVRIFQIINLLFANCDNADINRITLFLSLKL